MKFLSRHLKFFEVKLFFFDQTSIRGHRDQHATKIVFLGNFLPRKKAQQHFPKTSDWKSQNYGAAKWKSNAL